MTFSFETARDLQRARFTEAGLHVAGRHDDRRIRRPMRRGEG